jgi:hypothetical protein
MHRQGRRNSRHLSRTRQYHAATVDLRSSRLPPADWELLMSIADRLIRRLLARSLEPMVREAVAEQLASIGKDPLREPLIYGDATRLHIDPTAVVNNALFNLSSGISPSGGTRSLATTWRHIIASGNRPSRSTSSSRSTDTTQQL